MREIKFRAYDTASEVMVNFNNPKHGMQFCCGAMEVSTGWDGYGNPTYDGEDSHFEIMQYTGLKDKNGVEVYEGDILGNSAGWLAVIVWEDSFCGEYVGFSAREYSRDGNYSDVNTITGESPDFYVIGNIYETPHLLEGAK